MPRSEAAQVPIIHKYWVKAGEWEFRYDNPGISGVKRHVHVRKVKKPDGEYSWNFDGTRHHEDRFTKGFPRINEARKIAAAKLKINPNTLQFLLPMSMVVSIKIRGVYVYKRRAGNQTRGGVREGYFFVSENWFLGVTFRYIDRVSTLRVDDE